MGTSGCLAESQSSGFVSSYLLWKKKNPVMMCLNSSRVLILYLNKESNDKKQKVE